MPSVSRTLSNLKSRISSIENWGTVVAVIYGIILILLLVWLGVITGIYNPDDDDDGEHEKIEILQEDVNGLLNCTEEFCMDPDSLQSQIDILNTTINQITANSSGVVAKVILTAATLTNISSTEFLPLDWVIEDPFSLYNTSALAWFPDRDGYWEMSACVLFDLDSTPGFPTNLTHDFQIQVFIDGSFAGDGGGFLDVETFASRLPISEPEPVQISVCGHNIYSLTSSQNIALKIQTRIYPFTILPSSINGGAFANTRATLTYVGSFPSP